MRSRYLFSLVCLLTVWGCASHSPLSRAKRHSYPRVANVYLTDRLSADQAKQLAAYDLLILGLENQVNNPASLQLIKDTNPDVIVLCYVSSNEFPEEPHHRIEGLDGPWHRFRQTLNDSDQLRDPDGDIVRFWPGTWTYNLTQATTRTKLERFILDEVNWQYWDGVFLDNVWSDMSWYNEGNVDADNDGQADPPEEFSRRWLTNSQQLIANLRREFGDRRVIIANEDRRNFALPLINGRLFEGYPNTIGETSPAALTRMLDLYRAAIDSSQSPALTTVHAEANEDELDTILFGLTFALLGDGYFAVDHGPNATPGTSDSGWHDRLWWFTQFYEAIGTPTGPAYEVGSHVWIREFSQATVVWNPNDSAIEIRTASGVPVAVPPHTGRIHRNTPPIP